MIEFKIGDTVVDEKTLLDRVKSAPKRQPSKRDAPLSFHKGWRVVGHPPGSMECAKQSAEREWEEYKTMSPKKIMEMYPGGKGIPKPWDEASWRRNSPLRAVRSKPYEIHSSAVECMRLAQQSGWSDLRIDTLSKGESGSGGLF